MKDLHEILLQRIAVAEKFNLKETEVIWQFINELDLIDDISFDALKKANYRLRKEKKII